MRLTVGKRIGPYEITGTLGAGGMGEVYRATDTNLGRQVAIKVLPDTLANDPERLARFEREAKTLAALNHPNIAQIYGFEKADGIRALVMELVEGPTLDDRIAQGPIAVDEALSIAKQIAEALEAAHEQSIIHRDLKPANIKIRPDGTVKVLDFGLAKALEPASGAIVNATASPTITSPAMTGVGVLLGTAAYMSPEQARGKSVDKRADIWAFGCVLFEMLTGKRAFEDEDVSMTLSKILQRDPDFRALPADTPASIRHTLRLCLEKDLRERIQAMGDVRLPMAGAFETASSERLPVQTGHGATAIAVSAVVLASILAGTVVWFTTRPASEPVVRTEIGTSGGAALSIQGLDRDLVVTPDGARVVYRGADGLFVRGLSELEPMPLGRVDNPRSIFVSPDGEWVGFFAGGSMNKIPISGGSSVTTASIGIYTPRGAAWGPDGTVIFATSAGGIGLQRVSADGGEPAVLTKPDTARQESGHHWPEFLPGGEAVLFTIVRTGARLDDAEIALLDLATGAHRTILRGGSHAHYVPSGHLVYGTPGGTLQAVPFDLRQRAVVGTPVPVVERVVMTGGGAVDAAIASNGTLVYAAGVVSRGERRLVWVNRDGTVEPVRNIEPNAYRNLRISPDGRRVALLLDGDIWIHDVVTGRRTRLTRDQSVTNAVAWDPAGSRVAYTSTRAGSQNAWIQPADGSSDPRQLTMLQGIVDVDSWSPDGQLLAIHHHRPDGGLSMLMLPMGRDDALPEPFVDNEAWAEGATFSPDGQHVAYMSRETGQYEVYIRAYPRTGGSTPVSVGGGREALWAATGELFYRNEAGDRMMVATVVTQPTLHVGNPKEVFRGRFAVNLGGSPRPIYDLTRDGRRFLMLQDTDEAEDASQPRLLVVQNWLDELKRRVPTN